MSLTRAQFTQPYMQGGIECKSLIEYEELHGKRYSLHVHVKLTMPVSFPLISDQRWRRSIYSTRDDEMLMDVASLMILPIRPENFNFYLRQSRQVYKYIHRLSFFSQ